MQARVNPFLKLVLMSGFYLMTVSANGSQLSPAGLWKTHDDKGKPTGYVRILEENGVYTGVIEKAWKPIKRINTVLPAKMSEKTKN